MTLGAFVIWSEKNVAINTAHVVVGALTLATSLVLTLRSHQVRFSRRGRRPFACARPIAHGIRGARMKDARTPDVPVQSPDLFRRQPDSASPTFSRSPNRG